MKCWQTTGDHVTRKVVPSAAPSASARAGAARSRPDAPFFPERGRNTDCYLLLLSTRPHRTGGMREENRESTTLAPEGPEEDHCAERSNVAHGTARPCLAPGASCWCSARSSAGNSADGGRLPSSRHWTRRNPLYVFFRGLTGRSRRVLLPRPRLRATPARPVHGACAGRRQGRRQILGRRPHEWYATGGMQQGRLEQGGADLELNGSVGPQVRVRAQLNVRMAQFVALAPGVATVAVEDVLTPSGQAERVRLTACLQETALGTCFESGPAGHRCRAIGFRRSRPTDSRASAAVTEGMRPPNSQPAAEALRWNSSGGRITSGHRKPLLLREELWLPGSWLRAPHSQNPQ